MKSKNFTYTGHISSDSVRLFINIKELYLIKIKQLYD